MTERNNLERTAPPPAQPIPENSPQMPQVPMQGQGAAMEFSVPTEFVELPSGGKFYPQGHPLHGKKTLELKFMTAKEEDILASTSLIKKGVVFDRLLQSLIMEPINPDDLLTGDRNALLIAARMTGYGNDYKTAVSCPSCRNKSKFNFDLSKAKITNSIDQEMRDLADVQETDNGTFIINIESMNAQIEVRPLCGRDEKKLNSIASAKNRNNLQESAVTDGLKSYIVSVNGNQTPGYINQFVDALPARESRKIRIIYKNIVPKVSIQSFYSCAKCGHEQELEVPLNIDFFWPDE